MQVVKPEEYIRLGLKLSFLENAPDEWTKDEALDTLNEVHELLKSCDCSKTITDLNLEHIIDEFNDSETDEIIAPKMLGQFRKIGSNGSLLAQRDCDSKGFLMPEELTRNEIEKRYDGKKFLEFFDEGIYGRLPWIARQDLFHAARCYACEEYTAAAVLLVRAVEVCLDLFYRIYLQKEPVSEKGIEKVRGENWHDVPKSHMWEIKLRHLEKNDVLISEHQNLIDRLRFMKDFYRNPLAHGKRIYTDEKPVELWLRSIWLVNQMYEIVRSKKLSVCICLPLTLDAIVATYLINEYACQIETVYLVGVNKKRIPDAGYNINTKNGQFSGKLFKPRRAVTWLVLRYICKDRNSSLKQLQSYIEDNIKNSNSRLSFAENALWVYIKTLVSECSRKDINLDFLTNLWPLVKKYENSPGDYHNPRKLEDFINELSLPKTSKYKK